MNKPRILFWHRKDLRIFDNKEISEEFTDETLDRYSY